ncbi:MAG: integration host factor subunit beta [Syntrophaceae bacterium]|nr:integration host factor subunit beta [Syntrophaceae bacterium]
MTKRALIAKIQDLYTEYPRKDVARAVEIVFESMVEAMTREERIEIRGFGNFTVRKRDPRRGRNPMTGASVDVPPRRFPFFKVGKELKERVDQKSEKVQVEG